MSTKTQMIRWLLQAGRERDLYDLLIGTSPYNKAGRTVPQSIPGVEVTKLVGLVREHLYFVSKFGAGETHVIGNGRHYFAYPGKLAEWLDLDAPGIHDEDLERLYATTQ